MVGRHSLQLDLHFALHGTADREVWVLLLENLKDDLLLNEVLVLIRADPGGSSAKSRRVLLVIVHLSDLVVLSVRAHDVESVGRVLGGHRLVGNLVEVVMDHLAQVDEGVLLDLNLGVHVNLYSGGVNDAKIADEVLAALADDHELGFPELLVVGDLVVVSLTFTDLVDTLGAVDGDLQVLELLSINSLKFHVQLVGGSLIRDRLKSAAAKIDGDLKLLRRELAELDSAQVAVAVELVEAGVRLNFHAAREAIDL